MDWLPGAGEIYRAEYDGWYCVTCERFYTKKDLVDRIADETVGESEEEIGLEPGLVEAADAIVGVGFRAVNQDRAVTGDLGTSFRVKPDAVHENRAFVEQPP